MQVETQIGDYFVTYMAFPAFPRAQQPGRVNLYASRIGDGAPFLGEVVFKVRDDSWFSGNEEVLGRQPPDDNVFRQGFVFQQDGDYIITAQFEAGGEPYVIDFPLRIGDPSPLGPIAIAVGVIFAVLIGVSIVQRKKMQRLKVRAHQQGLRGVD
jgi:hypothetical protein